MVRFLYLYQVFHVKSSIWTCVLVKLPSPVVRISVITCKQLKSNGMFLWNWYFGSHSCWSSWPHRWTVNVIATGKPLSVEGFGFFKEVWTNFKVPLPQLSSLHFIGPNPHWKPSTTISPETCSSQHPKKCSDSSEKLSVIVLVSKPTKISVK